jgi:hypothetical protein
MTKLKFFIKVKANNGANIIIARYCLLNLSNTKWSTYLLAIEFYAPTLDMIK